MCVSFRSAMLFALAACLLARGAPALDRIIFEAEEATTSAGSGTQIRAVLDLTPAAPKLEVRAAELRADAISRPFSDITLACDQIVIREPRFACEQGRLRVRNSAIGALAMQARGELDSQTRAVELEASGLSLAGGSASLDLKITPRGWRGMGHAEHLALPDLRRLSAPWLRVPKSWQLEGSLSGDFTAAGIAAGVDARLKATVSGVALSNEEATVATQALEADLDAHLVGSAADASVELAASGNGGQALAGPVFLDLNANPLHVQGSGRIHDRAAEIGKLEVHAPDLIDAEARGTVSFARSAHVRVAHVVVQSLKFPAAYTSLLQNRLAATDFGALQVQGSVAGELEIISDAFAAVDLKVAGIDITDARKRVGFEGLQADIHWRAAGKEAVDSSSLEWSRGMLYGISGGATRLSFKTEGDELTLLSPAHVPVLDGAIVVNEFRIARPGDPSMDLDFDARIDPISMSKLSLAFGWPELAGSLSGRIPELRYHERELAVGGDIEASVFDGTIVARNLRLQDPFGPWPRLFADVSAHHLDLDLLTHTFPIGSITGRVDLDLRGLELFDWSPVAFDAKIFTSPGDRSRHRISQRAITSIAGVSGGGGTVAQALGTGFLRFFDTFHYDRLGLACQLRNDVCLMSGIEPTGTGYYIVKGGGLPRIDIIGNAGRVDWPTLVAQLEAGMHSQNIIVR